ncbi:MAG: D-3-phosphoglycerate dehydrogenase [Porticoccaceae bacterium]|nr:MAG: D-3-phosphoglycerate dehydrogenase [Porticoccaceae bacterium]
MFKIRTYNAISPLGLARFPAEHYRVGPDVADPDAILLRSHKLHGEPLPATVLAVARAGAGVNNIPVEACTERGIVVFNTPGANANAVKELVAAALFLSARDIFGGMSYVQSLGHLRDAAELSRLVEKEKKRFAGSELAGKTLGVVGLGAIGSLVANLALDLGMEVLGYDPAISVEAAWRLSSRVRKMDSLTALLAQSDYVTLHVPATAATRHLINRETLAQIKPGAKLLNFAREEVVDVEALIEALDNGRLGGYVSDFPRPELIGRRNVLLMPHIGASTREAEENCAVMAAEQLIDFLENGNIRNSVNFPPTAMARAGGHRLTFSNANVPKVLSNVLALLSASNNNVIDLVNKSRDAIAYNIVDVEERPSEETLARIRATEGVIRVRLL